jgi:hypothetical protein
MEIEARAHQERTEGPKGNKHKTKAALRLNANRAPAL